MQKLILATEQGIVFCAREGGWHESFRALKDRHVTSITKQEDRLLAGTDNGVLSSEDGGKTWKEIMSGPAAMHIRWMAFHPGVSRLVFAGTEPANILLSHDAGETWRACEQVAQLRDRHRWSLPYSPEAGCVRGFAFHGSRAYAAVEVGGVLISDDNGETWQLAKGSNGNPDLESPPEPLIYPDVHSIEVHPSSPDLVYAPTGGGFYRSNDGGKTWRLLYDCYCRAVWVDPRDPEHLILGPADYVDSNGRIEESRDGGESWSPASDGLKVPWRRGMVERFYGLDDLLFAVLSNGQLFRASLSSLEWQRILPNVTGVNAVTGLA